MIKNIRIRQTLLDRAVDGERWDFPRGEERVAGLGLLDTESRVAIPVLARDDKLLKSLRSVSKKYAKQLSRELDIEPLAQRLDVDLDEAFAMAPASSSSRYSR